jgi:putative DNA-invertase from lambdoid prophage Rac
LRLGRFAYYINLMPDVACFGYVRCSTLSQVIDGDGLAVQREAIERWASYQSLRVAELAEDAGVSGANMSRPGLRRILRSALEHGSRAVLVTYKLDRLGRNAIDVQETLAVLLDAGVRVVSIADGVDSASGMGAALLKLLTSILATFAELEKEGIRTRLLDGRRRADATDRKYASEPRYGRREAGEKGPRRVPRGTASHRPDPPATGRRRFLPRHRRGARRGGAAAAPGWTVVRRRCRAHRHGTKGAEEGCGVGSHREGASGAADRVELSEGGAMCSRHHRDPNGSRPPWMGEDHAGLLGSRQANQPGGISHFRPGKRAVDDPRPCVQFPPPPPLVGAP